MHKKIWLSFAVLLLSALPARAARAATITLDSTCTFAEAVAWVNTPTSAYSKDGCTRTGSFGTNDTVIVGLNYAEFSISSTVEIKKSLLVASWSFFGYLNVTDPNLSRGIKIAAKDILVRFSGIVLTGASENTTTGIHVDGTNDSTNSFTAKLKMNDCRITGFRRSGISIYQGGVDLYNTTLEGNSNRPGMGGAVRIESLTKYGRLNAENCWFSGNTAQKGGAIYNHGNLNVTSSYFTDNVATKFGGGGTGAAVFAKTFPDNYYTAFGRGGTFEDNRADTGGYAIAGGAKAEFAGSTAFDASGNTSGTDDPPLLCQDAIGAQGCPTQ
jgi:predicted outer membrane repeat protein